MNIIVFPPLLYIHYYGVVTYTSIILSILQIWVFVYAEAERLIYIRSPREFMTEVGFEAS